MPNANTGAADDVLGDSETWSSIPEAFTSDLMGFPDIAQLNDNSTLISSTDSSNSLCMAKRQPHLLIPGHGFWYDGVFWASSLDMALASMLVVPPSLSLSQPRPPPCTKFFFLANFTSTAGFASSFDCGTPRDRKRIMMALNGEPHHQPTPLRSLQHGSVALCGNEINSSIQQQPSFNISGVPDVDINGDAVLGNKQPHPLALTCQEIVIGIRETAQSRYWHGKLRWSAMEEVKCRQFFHPDILERNLAAFWSMWYPNAPIIHKPTYDAAQKPATLTASMALIGASLAAEREQHQQALYWSDLVEAWVFSSPELAAHPISPDNYYYAQYKSNARVNALQAAYAMVLFLTWEGTDEGKKRARRGRFAQTIEVARSLYPFASAHGKLHGYLATGNMFHAWKAFAQKEEMIRTILYVFLLDSAYTIFNNSPPRMDLDELRFPIACPEACFQVSNVDTWSAHVKVWEASHVGKIQPSVIDLLYLITKNELSVNDGLLLREMSSLDFFIAVSGKCGHLPFDEQQF